MHWDCSFCLKNEMVRLAETYSFNSKLRTISFARMKSSINLGIGYETFKVRRTIVCHWTKTFCCLRALGCHSNSSCQDWSFKTGQFVTKHVCSKKKFCKHVVVHTWARTSYLQSQPLYCNSLWKPWFFEFLSGLKFTIQSCQLRHIAQHLDSWSCWTIGHVKGLHGLHF